MITIISSTNRPGANSLLIANYYKQLVEELGAKAQVLNLQDLPADSIVSALYDNTGKNDVFNTLAKEVGENQKFVFIIPEYNGSFPGVLKAFVDGLDYPNTFKNKTCALVGLSSGIQGGILAMSHFTDILNYLGADVLGLKVKIPHVEKNFDGVGLKVKLHAELMREQAEKLIKKSV